MMRKLLSLAVAVVFVLSFASCNSGSKKDDVQETTQWEYKVLRIEGFVANNSYPEMRKNYLILKEDELNKLGKDGWELVDSYTELETVHPNFGNEKYVTGLQPNVRSSELVLVFKRLKQDKH